MRLTMKPIRLYNFRTEEYDQVEVSASNLFDYFPQDYHWLELFENQLVDGKDPVESAFLVLEAVTGVYVGSSLAKHKTIYTTAEKNLEAFGHMMEFDIPANFIGDLVETPEMNYRTVTMEKHKVALRQYISKHLLEAKVEMDYDYLREETAISIRGYVWAEQESVRYQEVIYPMDWWQAFKERWFPKWLLARHPVEYKKITLDVRALYPTYKRVFPKHQAVLQIRRLDESTWLKSLEEEREE